MSSYKNSVKPGSPVLQSTRVLDQLRDRIRYMHYMRLRIKDVDFDRQVIIVRDAKGGKDRVVMLPRSLVAALRLQLQAARALWEADRRAQRGGVETPHALEQKYLKVG